MRDAIERRQITGLVLAGGEGRRMGGADKGLQTLRGQPLAWHALQRLAPQVGPRIVCANRHAEAYAAFGVPVIADGTPGFAGPLAGLLAGARHCSTPWLLTVPCDTPHFPVDLAARLADAVCAMEATVAMAATSDDGRVQPQPVFCLLAAALAPDLAACLAEGGGSIARWAQRHRCAEVLFDDADAFNNVNTLEELRRLQ